MSSITNRRIVLGLGLLALCVAISVAGSGAFQTTAADRSVSVSVVDDERAFVGYESPSELSFNVSSDERKELVTLENRFQAEVRVENVDTNDVPVDLSIPTELDTGEEASIWLDDCEESLDGDSVHVTITVEGDGLRATVMGEPETRTIEVDCHS